MPSAIGASVAPDTQKRVPDSRREILDAAAKLFLEKGYGDTSLRELAARVGMKAGSLYYHFTSKEQLAIEVLRIGVDTVAQTVRARIEEAGPVTTPAERVSIAIHAHLEALLLKSEYTSAHIRCFPYTPLAVQEELRAVRRAYEDIWARLIDDLLGPDRVEAEARYLRLAVLGALNWSLEWFDPKRDDAGDYAKALEQVILRA
ncbi:TetR/AcrR family transcriptional regulator [Hoeflea sp. TYP-13]|uniref:TetR/AcrR family transcriptional regulator n=1 Tax=Hoeflea sp. TYP-13 TaxID=3230023 RepID=UPI0034C6BA25